MQTEYKFERGNYSIQSEYYKCLVNIVVDRVTYVYDTAGRRIGWIPAKEGIAKTLLPGSYTGRLISDVAINVNYAKSDLMAEQGKSLDDFTVETRTHLPINRQNTFTPEGTGVSFTNEISTKPQTMLQNLIETNKQAAKQAAYLEAGRLANETLANIMAKKFPQLPQTPFNALVLANIADQVAKNFKPNPQLAKLTAAMTTQAFLELYGMIDLDGVITEFINGTDSIALGEYVDE